MILSVYVKKPLKAGYHCNLMIFILYGIKNGILRFRLEGSEQQTKAEGVLRLRSGGSGSRQKTVGSRLLPTAHYY